MTYRIPPAQLAKAKAAWAIKAAARAIATNCCRCGKPHDRKATGHKQCPACLAYAAEYRRRKRVGEHGATDAKTVAALEKRVANLEHYFARLCTAERVAYNRGYVAGRRLHRRAAESQSYRDAMEARGSVGFEDLQQLSHAYAR